MKGITFIRAPKGALLLHLSNMGAPISPVESDKSDILKHYHLFTFIVDLRRRASKMSGKIYNITE